MNNLKNIIILIIFNIMIVSCSGGWSDAAKVLRNDKLESNDEFLIQKKQPLSQPPNFEELKKPSTQESRSAVMEQSEFDKIFKSENNDENISNGNTTAEESILKQIK